MLLGGAIRPTERCFTGRAAGIVLNGENDAWIYSAKRRRDAKN
jgi:hypothetical protein